MQGTGYWFTYEDKLTGRPTTAKFPFNADVRFHFRTRADPGFWVRGVFYLVRQTSPHMAGALLGLDNNATVYCMRAGYCKDTIATHMMLNAYSVWGEWPSGLKGIQAMLLPGLALNQAMTPSEQLSALQLGTIRLPPSVPQIEASIPPVAASAGSSTSDLQVGKFVVFARCTSVDWIRGLEERLYIVTSPVDTNSRWASYNGEEAVLIQHYCFSSGYDPGRLKQILGPQPTTVDVRDGQAVPLAAKRIYFTSPVSYHRTFGAFVNNIEEYITIAVQEQQQVSIEKLVKAVIDLT